MTFMTEDMMMIKNAKLITEKNNSRKIKIRDCKITSYIYFFIKKEIIYINKNHFYLDILKSQKKKHTLLRQDGLFQIINQKYFVVFKSVKYFESSEVFLSLLFSGISELKYCRIKIAVDFISLYLSFDIFKDFNRWEKEFEFEIFDRQNPKVKEVKSTNRSVLFG